MGSQFFLSAVIITLNEEKKIEKCLRSLDFADEIVLVDSGSTDRTVEIAKKYSANVFNRAFDSFSNQKNYAISKASGEWLLLIDADERVPTELKNEIQEFVREPGQYAGATFKRNNYMFGGRVRFGGNANDWQLRLIRRGAGEFKGLVHERLEVQGNVYSARFALIHETYQTDADYFAKFDLYTDLEAKQIIESGRKITAIDWLLKPVVQFFLNYIFRFGFLDGMPGLKYQLYSSYYTYVKYRKALRLKNSGL